MSASAGTTADAIRLSTVSASSAAPSSSVATRSSEFERSAAATRAISHSTLYAAYASSVNRAGVAARAESATPECADHVTGFVPHGDRHAREHRRRPVVPCVEVERWAPGAQRQSQQDSIANQVCRAPAAEDGAGGVRRVDGVPERRERSRQPLQMRLAGVAQRPRRIRDRGGVAEFLTGCALAVVRRRSAGGHGRHVGVGRSAVARQDLPGARTRSSGVAAARVQERVPERVAGRQRGEVFPPRDQRFRFDQIRVQRAGWRSACPLTRT